jgi:hypothetical protein
MMQAAATSSLCQPLFRSKGPPRLDERTTMMRKRELEKLLYKAVADALGVELPSKTSVEAKGKARQPSLAKRQPERVAA